MKTVGVGTAAGISSTKAQSEAYAVSFDQKALMASPGLQGDPQYKEGIA